MGIPFTRENAREMALRGNAKRWSPENRAKYVAQEDEQPEANSAEEYIEKRLARVRKQLDRIDKMMMDEDEPQKLDRLASAQSRLSEQERILAGRPTPGALRPTSSRSKDRKAYAKPAASPTQQVVSQPDSQPPITDTES